MFRKKSYCLIVWFWYQIMVFPKTTLFINLKIYFSKYFFSFFLSFVFISIYGFSQASWMYLITKTCIFSIRIHDLVLVLNLFCVQHSLFHYTNCLHVFQPFPFSFFMVRKVNHCDVHNIFFHETSISTNYSLSLSSLQFFNKIVKTEDLFLCHWSSVKNIYVPIPTISWLFAFIIIFYVFTISFHILKNSMKYRS